MRIVFLGTPDFGIPALKRCVADGHEVAAVITQPDRPRGRGHQMMPCPLKEAALELGLPVLSPEKINTKDFLDELEALCPDIMVTAAYGQILKKRILTMAPHGIINIHGSILPEYRGAAPIQWALIEGKEETGVTIMQTARGVDTGDMLLCLKTPITPEDTAETLFDRLAQLGAEALSQTLRGIDEGTIVPVPQEEALATHCRMLEKSDGYLDFSDSARMLSCRVRGVTPWPGAQAMLHGKVVKILSVQVLEESSFAEPGTIVSLDAGIDVAAGKGTLRITRLQEAGKKPLQAMDYLRGHALCVGDRWETCQ